MSPISLFYFWSRSQSYLRQRRNVRRPSDASEATCSHSWPDTVENLRVVLEFAIRPIAPWEPLKVFSITLAGAKDQKKPLRAPLKPSGIGEGTPLRPRICRFLQTESPFVVFEFGFFAVEDNAEGVEGIVRRELVTLSNHGIENLMLRHGLSFDNF